jgi:hypothetical protein
MKLALSLAFALALAVGSASAAGPYKLDVKGKCHDASGKFAKQTLCTTPAAASKHCRNPKTGKFVKCGTAGAVPA